VSATGIHACRYKAIHTEGHRDANEQVSKGKKKTEKNKSGTK
jgi:hypothetical protein